MFNELKKLEEHGYINLRSNGSGLWIANYKDNVQYDNLWSDHELIPLCRGLIVDDQGNIIKRPFRKFFNIEEHSEEELPDEPFEVTEKLDGCLNILYYDHGEEKYRMASRGSFNSWHSQTGTRLLHDKYSDYLQHLDDNKTYLFELIHPENMIVVNYGQEKKLVLLAVIDTKSGEEYPLEDTEWPDKVTMYSNVNEIKELMELDEENREGFVIRFRSGFRAKVKLEWYKRVHRIVSGVHTKAIWEYLSENRDLEEMLSRVPDEFYEWVQDVKNDFLGKFRYIKFSNWALFQYAPAYDDRKEFAQWAKQQDNPHILFAMLDGNEEKVDEIIWKQLKPDKAEFFNKE